MRGKGGLKLRHVINYQSEFMRYKSGSTLREVFEKTKWKFVIEFSTKGGGVSHFIKKNFSKNKKKKHLESIPDYQACFAHSLGFILYRYDN